MSGFEIAGVVLAIPSTLHLINRTVVAIKEAKNVPKGVLELLEVIRVDVERLSELSREHGDFFDNPSRKNSVQGLHDDLQTVLRECEAKYLGKKSLLKQVKKVLSEGDVGRDLTRIHQKIQMAYSKWMVGGLDVRFQVLENRLDVNSKTSSARSGTGPLSVDRGKKGKSSKLRSRGIQVVLPGADAARKRGDIAHLDHRRMIIKAASASVTTCHQL